MQRNLSTNQWILEIPVTGHGAMQQSIREDEIL